jgi:lipoprotein-releasing system permease protein
MSYTSLSTSQTTRSPKSYITDLQVNLYDKESAVPLAKEFHTAFNLDAIDYQTANSQFETGSTVRSIILCSIVLFVVAGFGIYNILNMMIYEKWIVLPFLKLLVFPVTTYGFISLSIIIGLTGGILD